MLLTAAALPLLAWSAPPMLGGVARCACPRVIGRTVMEAEDDYSVEFSTPPPMAMPGPGMSPCSIKVIGVGGGGGNTLNRMVSAAGGR